MGRKVKNTNAKNTEASQKKDNKPKETAAERQARAKANYKELRAAGFSVEDAKRYRYATAEHIEQALKAKALPQIETKKRGRAKNYLKITSETKQHPYVRQKTLTLDTYSGEKYLKAVIGEIRSSQAEGYTDYSITITFTWASGMQTFASTPMDDIKSISNTTDLEDEIAAAISHYLERYKQGTEDPMIDIEINLWDYSKKGKKAG